MARSSSRARSAPTGRAVGRIGGQLATASALAELGARLIEIHGQHGSLRLLEQETQTAFLDRAAGDGHLAALAAYRETYGRLRDVRAAAADLEEASRERERELDLLAYQAGEIEAVGAAPRRDRRSWRRRPGGSATSSGCSRSRAPSRPRSPAMGRPRKPSRRRRMDWGRWPTSIRRPRSSRRAPPVLPRRPPSSPTTSGSTGSRSSSTPSGSRRSEGQDRGPEGAAAQVRRHRRRRARVPAGGVRPPGRPVVGGRTPGGAAAGARRAGGGSPPIRLRTSRRAEPRPRRRSATS